MHFQSEEISYKDVSFFNIHGRTLTDNIGLHFSWSNSGLELKFKGNRIEFHFEDYVCENPVYVKAFAKETTQRFCLCGTAPKVIYDFEKESTHTIKLLRISEDETPLVLKSIRIYGKSPKFLVPPPPKKFKIEFMGDSITCGFGVLAPKSQSEYSTYEQDSTKAYAYMTAELLNADIRTVAIGGQGVYRNCAQEVGFQFKRMFNMATRTKDGYDHSLWTPDIFVLNCGTNDEPGGTTEETMYEEGKYLLDIVRCAYPDAKIIWMYGMMNSKFTQILKKLISDQRKNGDKNMYFLPINDIYGYKDEVGGVGHPNVNASIRVSKKLSKFILDILK